MLHSKAFVKVTKKGSVLKIVREHYLRDDIHCGIVDCSICEITSFSAPVLPSPEKLPTSESNLVSQPHYVVLDTNVLNSQNVIVPQITLEELHHLSPAKHDRLRKIIKEKKFYVFCNEFHRETFIERLKDESPNDRNDRAIRKVVDYYKNHLKAAVVLITEDEANRKLAREQGLICYSLKEYVESITKYSELVDMLVLNEAFALKFEEEKKITYEEHLPLPELVNGLRAKRFLQGTININSFNTNNGNLIGDVGRGAETIHIVGRLHLNRAINGDQVVVEVLPQDMWKALNNESLVHEDEDSMDVDVEGPKYPTAKVVGILKKNNRVYCGSLEKSKIKEFGGNQIVFFVPIDTRVPRIRIRTRQAHQLMNTRIVVAIDSWDKHHRYPFGHFIKKLGTLGDRLIETEALLIEHEVSYDSFAQSVLNCLPSPDWNISNHDLIKRRDLRDYNICSIDPPGCTDIDDALHCRLLPNGNYEVGVHIADVTHFVKPLTALDEEASNRCTTVYLVDKRIDMLPPLLGTNLCSLKSNVDRLSFSCIWELDQNAEIVNTEFTKSIIRSKRSFTYGEAQAWIDDPTKHCEITKSLRQLNALAKLLRKKRTEKGALTLASPEVRFQLENDSQDPVDVEMKELKETNALVEEFMLLANISVARKIYTRFPDCALLRKHPVPPSSNFDELQCALGHHGFRLDISSSKSLAMSLDSIDNKSDGYFNKLVRIMTTRSMMQAKYFSSESTSYNDFWHYGLATDIYTHFTSPIRRYADVLVHRLLAAAIQYEGINSQLLDKEQLLGQCELLNHRHLNAQHASRASVELFTFLYFKDKDITEEAYVIKIMKNGFIAFVPKYGIQGMVILKSDDLVFDTEGLVMYPAAEGPESVNKVKIFSKVVVSVKAIAEEKQLQSLSRRKLMMRLVKPEFPNVEYEDE